MVSYYFFREKNNEYYERVEEIHDKKEEIKWIFANIIE